MANPSSHSDDPERAARLRDDADEDWQAALDRADRLADYTPAPSPPARVAPTTSIEFLDAFERAIKIWEACDGKEALARGFGAELSDLMGLSKSLVPDAVAAYLAVGTRDPNAIRHYVLTDALFIGILVGRELPR